MDEYPVLTPPVIQRVMYAAITQRQREIFEEELELDFAYSVPGRARFRVNLYRQRDSVGAAFRIIPFEIKPLEDLGVPNDRRQLRGTAAWLRARDRSDRFRQVDDACVAARPGEPQPQGAHHDVRGPDRVLAPTPDEPGESARGR